MTAVIAAILAAFLAGAIALFREHRLQQRRLLVAARVTFATFGVAANGIRTSLLADGWAPFNALPGGDSFSVTWDTNKGDLAGHLTWEEWRRVETAVNRYSALTTMSQSESPDNVRGVMVPVQNALAEGSDALRPYCTHRFSVWKLLRRRLARKRIAGV